MAKRLFDDAILEEVTKKHVGKPTGQMFDDVIQELQEIYGPIIQADQPWITNPAGGLFYQIKFLAVAPSEYLFIGGCALPCTGSTGRHPVLYHDFMLSGGSKNVSTDSYEITTVRPGDHLVTNYWECFTASVEENTWFIEHCSGQLWSIMPFGLANQFLFTLDFIGAFRMVKCHMKLLFKYFKNGGAKQIERYQAEKSRREVLGDGAMRS